MQPRDATALAERFGLGTPARLSAGPVARGRQGVVWCLDTPEGRWAVKVVHEPRPEAEVALSARFQERAAAAGVPCPAVRRSTEGTVQALVGGTVVRLSTWVDLGAPDPSLDPALVGDVLGRLHRSAPEAEGPVHPWYVDPVGAGAWDRLVAALREGGAPFADDLAALVPDLVALEGWLVPPHSLRVCHRDLWADNVLPAPGGLCVIDWENAGPADPAQELGCAVFEFGRSDPGRARALVSAYRAAGGPARLAGRGDWSMLVAQLGHLTRLGAADWLSPGPRTPTRPDAEAWVREVLDDPHTPARLDSLLAVVR